MARAAITAVNDYHPPPLSKMAAIVHLPSPLTTAAMLGQEEGSRCACVRGTVGLPSMMMDMLGREGVCCGVGEVVAECGCVLSKKLRLTHWLRTKEERRK